MIAASKSVTGITAEASFTASSPDQGLRNRDACGGCHRDDGDGSVHPHDYGVVDALAGAGAREVVSSQNKEADALEVARRPGSISACANRRATERPGSRRNTSETIGPYVKRVTPMEEA